MSADRLIVNEIFFSIQGESTRAGEPCVFVRLTGCPLRCRYCDTEYAFTEGRPMSIDDILAEARRLAPGCRLVELTGGEPLVQPGAGALTAVLADAGYTVLIETSGACDIDACDPRSVRIVDLKTPGSGEVDRNDWANLKRLRPHDELKFVITDRTDYDWAKALIEAHDLNARVHALLMSPAHPTPAGKHIEGSEGLHPRELAEWILADGLDVRLQIQLHKVLWDPQTRGV